MGKFDAAEEITNQIIEAIESGLADGSKWVMPWHSNGALAMPVNALTGKSYRGANIIALWAAGKSQNFGSGYWASFKQWKELGAKIKKGSRGSMVVFWKKYRVVGEDCSQDGVDGTEDEDTGRTYMRSWASRVFNADQVEGWDAPEVKRGGEAERITGAENFLFNTGADIRYGEGQAFYNPSMDFIGMPDRDCFVATCYGTATDHFYSTLFHETSHWVGHKDRCNRDLSGRFGSDAYAAEELVVEISSCFICCYLGLSPQPRIDHFHYIKNWLDILKGSKYAIFTASSKAQEAFDYLQSLQPQARIVAAE